MKLKHLIFSSFICFLLIACNKEPIVNSEMSETFYLRNNGTDMPVFVRGNGESKVFVLLLHGGPGDGGLKYRGHTYSDLLEDEYAMVYWDQRHQGNSHGHMEDTDFTIDMMVEDTYALIQTLKVRYGDDISVFLMGHSWGGTLGTAFMLKDDYQHEVNGWIEVDGAHDFQLMNREMIRMINTIGQAELDANHHNTLWTEIIAYANSLDTNNISLDETIQLNSYAGRIEGLFDQLNEKSQSNLGDLELNFTGPNNPTAADINDLQIPSDFYDELINYSATPMLHKITTPTLLQWGEFDFKVPPKMGEITFNEISSTDKFLKIYQHSGHSPMRYEPALFVSDMIAFIEAYKN
ncbi:MAG: pimeloyl-ACP methyl ester carboxylesterase [Crocinitomix sp.]|jgi:pimeloyl-ACP methyl ester carboxylesterase